MIKKLKQLTVIAATMFAFVVPVMAPAMAHAANEVANSACQGAATATTGTNPGNDATVAADCDADTTGKGLNALIKWVINIFSIIVGAVSVIMIIYGGFKYITSSGDSGKVTSAKNTIMYALIGLAIVGLSQLIVYFVLSKSASVPLT